MPYLVENIVRKGEIACYKQFLLFSQCFPMLYILSASKCRIVWYGLTISSGSWMKNLFSLWYNRNHLDLINIIPTMEFMFEIGQTLSKYEQKKIVQTCYHQHILGCFIIFAFLKYEGISIFP